MFRYFFRVSQVQPRDVWDKVALLCWPYELRWMGHIVHYLAVTWFMTSLVGIATGLLFLVLSYLRMPVFGLAFCKTSSFSFLLNGVLYVVVGVLGIFVVFLWQHFILEPLDTRRREMREIEDWINKIYWISKEKDWEQEWALEKEIKGALMLVLSTHERR